MPRVVAGICSLLLLFVLPATGCLQPVSEAEVRAAYLRVEQLMRSNELEALAAQFAPAATIEMVDAEGSESYGVAQYLDLHRKGMELLSDYRISSQIRSVVIESGRATVLSVVEESGVMFGRPLSTRTAQRTVFVRAGQRLLIESVRGEVELLNSNAPD